METCFTWGSYENVLLSCFLIDGMASAEYSLNKFIFIYSIDLIIINPNLKSCSLSCSLLCIVHVCIRGDSSKRKCIMNMCLCCKKIKKKYIYIFSQNLFVVFDLFYVIGLVVRPFLFVMCIHVMMIWVGKTKNIAINLFILCNYMLSNHMLDEKKHTKV